MKVKGNAGEHLTTNAPYGYMKDPDDSKHWIPDREAADVVYEIGLYVMDGFGPSQIARKLRERKSLRPQLTMKVRVSSVMLKIRATLIIGTIPR